MSIDNKPKAEDEGEEAQNESGNKQEEDVSMELDTSTQASLFSSQQETDPVAIFQVSTEPLLESQELPGSNLSCAGVPHLIPSTPTGGSTSQEELSQSTFQDESCSNEQCRKKNLPCRRISFSPPSLMDSEPFQEDLNTSWNLVLSETATTQPEDLSREDSDVVPATQETASPTPSRSADSGIDSRPTFSLPVSSGSDNPNPPSSPSSHSQEFAFVKTTPDCHVNASLKLSPASTPLSSEDSLISHPMKSIASRKTPVISQTPDDFSFSEGDSSIPEPMDMATSEKQFRFPLLPKRGQTSTPTLSKDQGVQVESDVCPHCYCLSFRPFLQALEGVTYDPKKTYAVTHVTKLVTRQLIVKGEVVKSYTYKHREPGAVEEVTVPVESFSLESPPPVAQSTGSYPTDISSSLSSNSSSQEPSKKKQKLMSPEKLVCPPSPEIPLAMEAEPPASAILPQPPQVPQDLCPSPEIQLDPEAKALQPSTSTFVPGIRVMARWKDGYYYPGRITAEESLCRWMIKFDDGNQHSIWSRDIIAVDPLPEGQSVLTEANDQYFDPGIVRGYFRDSGPLGYIVESDTGDTRRYSRSAVILTADQATGLRTPAPTVDNPVSSAVTLDNMVEGRRRTRKPSTPSPSTVAAFKRSRVKRRPDPLLEASDASSTSSGSGTLHRTSSGLNSPVKRLTTTLPSSSDQKKGSKTSAMGPLPPGKIFQNYGFLLSYAEKCHHSSSELSDSTVSDDNRFYAEMVEVPYNKNYLRKQIQLGGGVVLDSFEQTQTTTCRHVFLLTMFHLRTIKYVQCLAAGIPCLSHIWVKNSCEQGKALDKELYLQPAGFSLLTGALIEWHGQRFMLQGMHIMLTSNSNPDFVDTWAPVLLSAGADIVRKYPPSSPSKGKGKSFSVDVVVTDPSCPELIVQRCQIQNTPLVSTEWVIHCLIHGARLAFDAHPKFCYTISTSP